MQPARQSLRRSLPQQRPLGCCSGPLVWSRRRTVAVRPFCKRQLLLCYCSVLSVTPSVGPAPRHLPRIVTVPMGS